MDIRFPEGFDESGAEKVKDKLTFVDFFQMSEPEKALFRERVKQSNGAVQVFMHPFYEVHNSGEPITLKDLTRVNRVNDGVNGALSTGNTQGDKPPLIIMEEQSNLEKTKRLLIKRQQNYIQNDVVMVPTGEGKSIPRALPERQPRPGQSSNDFIRENWQEFFRQLKDLGVTAVIIGGSFFWADGRGGNKDGTGTGCVGSAMKSFDEGGFKVQISDFTNPDSRERVLADEKSDFKKYL
jgi:hypothetical protein